MAALFLASPKVAPVSFLKAASLASSASPPAGDAFLKSGPNSVH